MPAWQKNLLMQKNILGQHTERHSKDMGCRRTDSWGGKGAKKRYSRALTFRSRYWCQGSGTGLPSTVRKGNRPKESGVKKAIMGLCLAAALVFGAAGVQAAEQDKGNNPVLQFTGSVWQKSSLDNKLSFLFGMDTAIATEYFVNSREAELAAKNGKMPVSNLSKFEKGWMKAFKDVKRTTIVEEVDAWYAAHPDRLDRPVLGVLWFELVEPRLAAAQ
ncbi:hypothetical protein [Desulfovibrio piger]|uniref:hypothetical protein n=1 Tax=Desulfovibrio piger TaxID=901 RepID=UPI0026EE882B|nr:hypothetical protein [Desulfovibrio piger]